MKPSLLAAACVGAAVKGFHWSRTLVYPEHHSDKFIIALSSIVNLKPVSGETIPTSQSSDTFTLEFF